MNSTSRALVVEDDPQIATLVAHLLRREGWAIDISPDGRDALRNIRANAYDVIVLDLMLPVVNGFEVLRELSALAPELLGRIIVLTAAAETTLAHLDASRVHALLRKPFDIAAFVHEVGACAAVASQKASAS